MFRALSTRAFRGYEKLTDEDLSPRPGSPTTNMAAKLERARSVPAKVFSAPIPWKSTYDHERKEPETAVAKQAKKSGKIHPMFNLVDSRSRKKAAAKPEFSRYLQYLKEGGIWELNSDTPVVR